MQWIYAWINIYMVILVVIAIYHDIIIIFCYMCIYIWMFLFQNTIYVVKMATVNRMKKKKQQYPTMINSNEGTPTPGVQHNLANQASSKQQKQQQQAEYQKFVDLSQCNPNGITSTSSLFPNSEAMNRHYNLPHGFAFSPMLSLQNQNCPFIEKTGDNIQRCGGCRSYMNCYNTFSNDRKKFTCFICGRDNYIDVMYKKKQDNSQEMTSSIYQSLSPLNFYNSPSQQDCFVFLVDISPDAYQSRMLYYMISVMKDILSREQYDDTYVYFFTYDEILQEYDFSGEQIRCTIMDKSISNQPNTVYSQFLKDIRAKLFELLDSLEEISQKNPRRGSNLASALQFVKTTANQLRAKIFIFQSNEALIQQPFFQQIVPKNKQDNPNRVFKSVMQSKNLAIFDACIKQFIQYGVSFSLFCFSKNFKNMRIWADLAKLTSSEIFLYHKDSEPDLTKFYYDFSYLLSTTYFKQVRLQLIISLGYRFFGIYGNHIRSKQGAIVVKMPYLEGSRKITVLIGPSQNSEMLPYVSFQFSVNYRYKRQDYLTVCTTVYPLTCYMDRLISSVDIQTVQCFIARTYLSSIRVQKVNQVKRVTINYAAGFWILLMQVYKKRQNFPEHLLTIFTSYLGMMKSNHIQLQSIDNTPIFDKIVSQRNFLQFCGAPQIANIFNPYLFDISNLEQNMCRQDTQFIYPYTIEPRFHNVKEGIFLMDAGLSLYLFIAQKYDPQVLMEIFGKQKITKNDQISEQTMLDVQTFRSSQIQVLLKILREQKSYGWAPLYIVRCGQNSMNQSNFFMNFYMEKCDYFRGYKVSIEEFIGMISQDHPKRSNKA